MSRRPLDSTLFPYTTLFRSRDTDGDGIIDQYGFSEVYAWPFVLAHGASVVKKNPDTGCWEFAMSDEPALQALQQVYEWNHVDRKSTRLNSSHVRISYAVFCL